MFQVLQYWKSHLQFIVFLVFFFSFISLLCRGQSQLINCIESKTVKRAALANTAVVPGQMKIGNLKNKQ